MTSLENAWVLYSFFEGQRSPVGEKCMEDIWGTAISLFIALQWYFDMLDESDPCLEHASL